LPARVPPRWVGRNCRVVPGMSQGKPPEPHSLRHPRFRREEVVCWEGAARSMGRAVSLCLVSEPLKRSPGSMAASGSTTRSGAAELRLAEVVAALSLGIDLGFGQPMEHVLRQCLIALRLAERVGLAAQARAEVYYTALLINVGCHTDAHEQAKRFRDDIPLTTSKYDHQPRSGRGGAD